MRTRQAGVLIAAVMLLGACGRGSSSDQEQSQDPISWTCDDGLTAVSTQLDSNPDLWKFEVSSGWSSTSEFEEMQIDVENFGCVELAATQDVGSGQQLWQCDIDANPVTIDGGTVTSPSEGWTLDYGDTDVIADFNCTEVS